MTREDFEDTVLFDQIGKYIVNETTVSVQYFLKNRKVAYFNSISEVGQKYSGGIDIADHIRRNLQFEDASY
jgi:hypothetical protein